VEDWTDWHRLRLLGWVLQREMEFNLMLFPEDRLRILQREATKPVGNQGAVRRHRCSNGLNKNVRVT
jgi:hypothetical protein